MYRIALVFVALFALSGCSGVRYFVSVDALAGSHARDATSYVLLPGIEGVDASDLAFAEYAERTRRGLAEAGFSEAARPEDADVAIFVAYGIGDPETATYTRTVPIYGYVPTQRTSVDVTTTGQGGAVRTTGTVSTSPRFAPIGTRTATYTETTFLRYAALWAFDLRHYRETGEAVQLWSARITSRGPSDDLRRVFPYLIAAGVPCFGRNPGERVDVAVPEDDDTARIIRTGAAL